MWGKKRQGIKTATLDKRWRYLEVDLTLLRLTDKLKSIDSFNSKTQKNLNFDSSEEMFKYEKHESVPELQQCWNLCDNIPVLIFITTK